VRCEDTETDPRADRLVCRKLELRSIVIVPVRVQGRNAGVLEAFSSRAHAFQSSDVLLLRRVTDLVAGIAVRQPETAASSITGPQALMAAATLEPLVAEPRVQPGIPLMMDDIFAVEEVFAPLPPPPEVTTPPASPPPEKVVAAPSSRPQPRPENVVKAAPVVCLAPPPVFVAPVVRPAPPPAVVAPGERPAPTPRVAAPVEAPKPGPAVETAVAPPAARAIRPELATRPAIEVPATRSSAVPRDMVAPSPMATAAMRAMGAAAVATSAAARYRPVPVELEEDEAADMLDPASMSDVMLANMPAHISSPWRLRLTGAGILAAVLIVGGWQVWRAIAPPRGTPMDSEVKQTKPVANTPAPLLASSTPTAPAPAVVPVNAVPGEKTPIPAGFVNATKPPAADKNAAARPAPAPASRGPVTTPVGLEVAKAEVPEAPPAMGLVRPTGSAAISSVLSVPVASPTLDKPVVSELTGGKLMQRYNPVRPSAASGLNGEVVLKATIGKDGTVAQVKIVSGHALLAQSAASAVKRWRYEPFRLNGVPIEIENTIVVNFKALGK
jgi:protein TonB